MSLQDRIKELADANGSAGVALHGKAEHAAARCLEKDGMVEIVRFTGTMFGGSRSKHETFAISLTN